MAALRSQFHLTQNMTTRPATSSATRASLLREVSKVSEQTLAAIADSRAAQARLAEAQATKDGLRQQMASAESELHAVKTQRRAEQENDAELTGLQRAVSTVTLKRQRLIADAKAARKDRDAARGEEREKLLFRLGAAVEVGRATGDLIIPGMPPWHPDVTALAVDAELLWKSASSQTEVVRDLVEAALACNDSALAPSTGADAASAPASLAAGSIYATLGAKALAGDCEKALKALSDLERDRSALLERTQRMLDSVSSSGSSSSEENGGERPLSADIDEAPLGGVAALLAVLETHLSMANALCCASLRAAAPCEESERSIEAAGGPRSAAGSMDSALESGDWQDAHSDG